MGDAFLTTALAEVLAHGQHRWPDPQKASQLWEMTPVSATTFLTLIARISRLSPAGLRTHRDSDSN